VLHVALLAAMMSLSAVMTLFMARVAMTGRYGTSSAALGLFFGLTTVSAGCLLATLLWPDTALQQWRAVIGAVSLPALYLHFALGSVPEDRPGPAVLWHLVPMLAVSASVLTGAFWAIDPILLVTYGVYLWALTRLLRHGARHFRGLGPHLGTTLVWLRIVIMVVYASLALEVAIFTELARGGAFEASLPLLLSTALFFGLISYALLGAMGRPSLFEHVYNLLAERAPLQDGARDKPQPEPREQTPRRPGKICQHRREPCCRAELFRSAQRSQNITGHTSHRRGPRAPAPGHHVRLGLWREIQLLQTIQPSHGDHAGSLSGTRRKRSSRATSRGLSSA